MGVALAYIRVSAYNAELLRRRPAFLDRFLYGEDLDTTSGAQKTGFFARLFGVKPKPTVASFDEQEDLTLEPRQDDDESDADKAWQAIHYLLTGTAEDGEFPPGFISGGGTPVGDEDVGYGPARLYTPDEVSQIDTVLQNETRDSLHARYNGKAMDSAGVYPQIWKRDGEAGFDYVWLHFVNMQKFVNETKAKGDSLLLYYS